MTITNITAQRNFVKPTFKGISKTEKGTPYHKANTGLVAGSVMGGLSLLQWLAITSFAEQGTRLKKYLIPFMAIAALSSVGCGMLVDYLRNKKAAEASDNLAKDPEKAVYNTEGIEYSERGLPYYKSNIGTKIGAGLGALCGLAHTAMLTTKNSPNKVLSFISNAVIFALGGLIMGTITDKITNNKAKKSAVEMQMGKYIA